MTNYNTADYNSIADYYRAISTIPLLTPTQEYLLAKKIRDARLEQNNALLEQRGLDSRLFQEGEQARDRFIQANLRLVVHVVNRYFTQNFASAQQLQSMTKMDLIEAGNIGLLQAVDSFDVDKGFSFSTYATRVIKNAVIAAIYKEDRMVRLPFHKENQVRQARVAGTIENLVDSADILFVLSIDRPGDLPPEMIVEESTIEITLATNPIEHVITRLDRQEIAKALLALLNPREIEIALALFVEGMKDAEVARNLGVSKMRIGQLKRAIQKKLKEELDRRHMTLSDVFDLFD